MKCDVSIYGAPKGRSGVGGGRGVQFDNTGRNIDIDTSFTDEWRKFGTASGVCIYKIWVGALGMSNASD